MKKAAIVTLYSENNYGNKLQNYAVVKCLNKWGYKAETLVVRSFFAKLYEKVFYSASRAFGPIAARVNLDNVRAGKFALFSKKYLSKKYVKKVGNGVSPALADKYDMFVTGSDQVWNPVYWSNEGYADYMLLGFVPAEKRRCFSPSFGITELPEKWHGKVMKELGKYEKLSSREESGAKIINDVVGREAAVTIDPTMMLDKEEWLQISKKVKGLPENYVLEYFLGKIPKDDEAYKNIPDGYERIKLLDKSNEKIYLTDPSEFIHLISCAGVVYTDSFHACVFSILFGKPFVVFERISGMKSMFSRIETLLEMFGLNARECIGKVTIIEPEVRDKVLTEKRAEVERLFN